MNRNEQRAALRQEWQTIVAQYHVSGQSVRSWCQEQELPEHKLRYWLRKFREGSTLPTTSSESRFVAVPSKPSPGIPSGIAVKVGHLSIEVQRGFDPQVLVEVVQSLTGHDQ